MGDDRKADGYEMAPQSDVDLEKGKIDPSQDEKREEKESENEWGGLNKAQLLEVADTPFWNWTRNILLILFWVGWVAMLVAAIVIVVKVPRCPEVEWWEKSVFYRVLPQSFKDTNGDGYGDLKGLTKKLYYIKGIGAEVLVLSSIYQQPGETRDLGQDIVNFTNVDPSLGSLKDFDDLLTKAGDNDLKVILEFVPNHSSDQHPWFLASVNGSGNYSDYYIWKDGDGVNPPNGWLNKYGDSAWTYNDDRKQYYYHYLLPEQPDLNYDNPLVRQEMEEALLFWLKRGAGVDGFIFSGVDYIYETSEVTTALGNRRRRQAATPTSMTASNASSPMPSAQPASPEPSPEPTSQAEPSTRAEPSPSGGEAVQYSCVDDSCSMSQEKLHTLLVNWRKILNDNSYLSKYRLMVTETAMEPDSAVLLYGNQSREADLVLYKGFAESINGAPTAQSIRSAVDGWIAAREVDFENRWNTWVLGDEHMSRIATRASEKFASALNVILLTLPGTPIAYYADELGTPDLTNLNESMDPVAAKTGAASRDPERGPMYWANTTTGNFTNGTAWLPLPSDNKYSVQTQDAKDNDMSVLSVFKALSKIHGEPSMTAGRYTVVDTAPDSIYAYIRQYPDWPGYLVVANFGASEAKLDFEVRNGDMEIQGGKLLVRSSGDMDDKKYMELDDVSIQSGEALVFKI